MAQKLFQSTLRWSLACTSIWMMAQSVTTKNVQDHLICKRFPGVKGDGDKQNDVIFCRNSQQPIKQHVVFFGGDVQDYPENMNSHRDNFRYVLWNLENTGKSLVNRFPNSAVYVVKPKEMFLRTFSVYSNFVDFTEDSLPTHLQDYGGLVHLVKLYKNMVNMAELDVNKEVNISGQSGDTTDTCSKDGCSDNIPLTLVGFSKGCVVINQFLHELELVNENEEVKNFLSNLKSIYWLDGGHNGGQNTWVTDDAVLKKFSELGIKIFVHVTPYQIADPMRAWIGKEEHKFVSKLRKFGADVNETKHFEDEPRSIENHFQVLLTF